MRGYSRRKVAYTLYLVYSYVIYLYNHNALRQGRKQCITPWARLASERLSERSALVCLKLKNGTWEILGDLQVTRFRRNRWVNCILTVFTFTGTQLNSAGAHVLQQILEQRRPSRGSHRVQRMRKQIRILYLYSSGLRSRIPTFTLPTRRHDQGLC